MIARMPTVFTHGLIGFTVAQAWRRVGAPRRLVLLSMTLAVLPDIDGIPYVLGLIPSVHVLGHRGVAHSLAAAVPEPGAGRNENRRSSPGSDRMAASCS